MDMGVGGGPAVLVLAELALFWVAAVVHVLRLLSPAVLPERDRPADAGHAVMGAGMTVMVFPGVPSWVLHVLAAGFAALAVVFFGGVILHRSAERHAGQYAAIGAGQAAMAYMVAGRSHSPAWLPVAVAAVLAVCALVPGRRLLGARRRRRHADGVAGVADVTGVAPADTADAVDTGGGVDRVLAADRMLVTVPHVGALMMTLAMAGMIAAS